MEEAKYTVQWLYNDERVTFDRYSGYNTVILRLTWPWSDSHCALGKRDQNHSFFLEACSIIKTYNQCSKPGTRHEEWGASLHFDHGGGLSSNFAATHVFTTSIYGMDTLIWEKTCVIHMHGGAEVLTIFGGKQQWPQPGCGVQRFSENKGLGWGAQSRGLIKLGVSGLPGDRGGEEQNRWSVDIVRATEARFSQQKQITFGWTSIINPVIIMSTTHHARVRRVEVFVPGHANRDTYYCHLHKKITSIVTWDAVIP